MTKFQVGKTYQCRSLCDYNTIFSYRVVARTAKRLTLVGHNEQVKRGIYEWDGVECCRPHGTYSMCPMIRADREIY